MQTAATCSAPDPAGRLRPAVANATWLLVCVILSFPPSYADDPPERAMFTDFSRLQRPSSPNTWLIAPADAPGTLQPDGTAAALDIEPAQLAAHWRGVVEGQPRTRILDVSQDGLRIEAEQRSALFGFVDRVSFEARAGADGRTSFYAYSRSELGYWDLGVNRQRLTAWVDQLLARVTARGQ